MLSCFCEFSPLYYFFIKTLCIRPYNVSTKEHFTLCYAIVPTVSRSSEFYILFHPDTSFVAVIAKTVVCFSLPSVENASKMVWSIQHLLMFRILVKAVPNQLWPESISSQQFSSGSLQVSIWQRHPPSPASLLQRSAFPPTAWRPLKRSHWSSQCRAPTRLQFTV